MRPAHRRGGGSGGQRPLVYLRTKKSTAQQREVGGCGGEEAAPSSPLLVTGPMAAARGVNSVHTARKYSRLANSACVPRPSGAGAGVSPGVPPQCPPAAVARPAVCVAMGAREPPGQLAMEDSWCGDGTHSASKQALPFQCFMSAER